MAFLKLYRKEERKTTRGNQGSPFNSNQTSTSVPGQPHSGEASSLLVAHLADQLDGQGSGWVGAVTKRGGPASTTSFACLSSSGTSGFAPQGAALGSAFICPHLPAFQLASCRGRGQSSLGGWRAHRGAICLGNCRISVIKQCTSCCDLGGRGGSFSGAHLWQLQATGVKTLGSWEKQPGCGVGERGEGGEGEEEGGGTPSSTKS